jgi:hypothetical protein
LIATAYCDLKKFADALDYYHRALCIYRKTKLRRQVAVTLVDVGAAQVACHKIDMARRSWREAIAIFADFGDPLADQTRARLDALDDHSSDAGEP